MRSAIGLLSFLAFGFLAAGVLTVVGTAPGVSPELSIDALLGAEQSGVHLASLMLGLVVGVVLSALARVSWAELPRRFIGWLLTYERSLYRLALAGVLVAVLIYY